MKNRIKIFNKTVDIWNQLHNMVCDDSEIRGNNEVYYCNPKSLRKPEITVLNYVF